MEFGYRLTGTGWSEARLGDGPCSVRITASYLGDALGELLEAVGVLLEGAEQARCSWAEEPGEYRWIFDRAGSDVRLRVLDEYGEDEYLRLWAQNPFPLRHLELIQAHLAAE